MGLAPRPTSFRRPLPYRQRPPTSTQAHHAPTRKDGLDEFLLGGSFSRPGWLGSLRIDGRQTWSFAVPALTIRKKAVYLSKHLEPMAEICNSAVT
jgi:hypothetical protein